MALWRLGFRPLFLFGSLFAALSVLLWGLQLEGLLLRPWISGPLTHGHEMLFGFTLAIVAGFLLTAVRNWTGLPTLSGTWLALLCMAWLAARVFALVLPGWPAALANQAFLLGTALALALPLWRARNRRNFFVVALLLAMALADAVFQWAQQQGNALLAHQCLQWVLDLLLFLLSVIAGRVVPMFTNNGVPGTKARNHAWLDRATLALMLLLALADLSALAPPWAGLRPAMHCMR